jgi:phosphate transport system substrate-binding protein
MTVASTLSLQSLHSLYNRCAAEQPGIGLVLLDTPTASLDSTQADLSLRWGDQDLPQGNPVVIGQEELTLIVHPQNPITQLDTAALAAIYSGTQRTWNPDHSGGEIHAFIYPTGEDTQRLFERIFLQGPAARIRNTAIVPDPAAMRESVAADINAIGYLPRRWMDATVKALPVSDIDPAQLRQPVLALSPAAPEGPKKAWLLCLQDQFGR